MADDQGETNSNKDSEKPGEKSTALKVNPPCPFSCGHCKCKAYKKTSELNLEDYVIIWMYGGPSCGKSTQCQKVAAKYNLTHLHAGDLLKKMVKSGSRRAMCMQNNMERGELVQTELVLELLRNEIEATPLDKTKGFVFDGFPREVNQGILFEQTISPCNAFLFLDAEKETLDKRHADKLRRSLMRWEDDNVWLLGPCVAGKVQLHVYLSNHKKIMEHYRPRMNWINAEGRTPEDIFKSVEQILDKIVARKDREVAARRAKAEEEQRLKEEAEAAAAAAEAEAAAARERELAAAQEKGKRTKMF